MFVNTHLIMRCAEENAILQLSRRERGGDPSLCAFSTISLSLQPQHISSFPLCNPHIPPAHLLAQKCFKVLLKMMEIFSASSVPCYLPPTTHHTDQVISSEPNGQERGYTRTGNERKAEIVHASLAPLYTTTLALPKKLVQFAPC